MPFLSQSQSAPGSTIYISPFFLCSLASKDALHTSVYFGCYNVSSLLSSLAAVHIIAQFTKRELVVVVAVASVLGGVERSLWSRERASAIRTSGHTLPLQHLPPPSGEEAPEKLKRESIIIRNIHPHDGCPKSSCTSRRLLLSIFEDIFFR